MSTIEERVKKVVEDHLSVNQDQITPEAVSYTHLRAHETASFISYAVFC